ncbi:MAG TPA: hypothetical protein VFY27_11325, partial [Woeseiaceae bacterium]|nr:hypothetical protein [Woeseiaceae bacterium]
MSPITPSRAIPALILAVLALDPASPAIAVETVQGTIAAITAEDWRVSGLSFSVDAGEPLNGSLRIASLELPSIELSLADVLVECRRIELSAVEFGCLDAEYTLDLPDVGQLEFPGEAVYERRSGATRFVLREIPLAQGKITLRGTATADAVEIEYSGEMLKLDGLTELAQRFTPGGIALTASGTGNLSGAARLRDGSVTNASMRAEVS